MFTLERPDDPLARGVVNAAIELIGEFHTSDTAALVESFAMINRTLALSPRYGLAWARLSKALYILGQKSLADRAFTRAVHDSPDDPRVWIISLARVGFHASHVGPVPRGEIEEARRIGERVADLIPSGAEGKIIAANLAAQRRRLDRCLASARDR